jgi:mono/diheme cytochrome c family protein
MKSLPLCLLLVITHACALRAAEGQVAPLDLSAAKEQGRVKSQFLQTNQAPTKPTSAVPTANVAHFKEMVSPLLHKHCVACHGPKTSEGRLRLDQLDPDLLKGADVERWREVFNALIKSEMPPADAPEPALAEQDRGQLVNWLSEELDKASIVRRNSKEHTSFRRLTKYEHNYVLQDLLGLPHSFANKLPPETASKEGFKNQSDLLQMSTMQFESYREVGLQALKRATVSGERPPTVSYLISMQEEYEQAAAGKREEKGKRNKNQLHLLNRELDESVLFAGRKPEPVTNATPVQPPAEPASPVVLVMPKSSELKLDLDRFLPDEGTMRVRVRAARSNMNPDEFASLRLVFSAHTSNNANFSQIVSERDLPVTAASENPEWIEFEIALNDIQRNPFRHLTTTFPRRNEFLHIQNISNATGGDDGLQVHIDRVEIMAPFYEQWPPKTHTEIFFASNNRQDEQLYGREVLQRFLRKVWRRPVQSQEVEPFLALLAKYRPDFATFEEAMVEVLATALASPEFIYLTQRGAPEKAASSSRLNEFELASRLAVFLWSSLPDETLLKLAEAGELSKPEVLSAQVERMLADQRSQRFTRNFVEQWLGLERMNSVTHVTEPALKEAMLQEPLAFFEEVLRNNHSILDFIDSDYAVVNERLAAHYQLPKVYGPHFRKVPVKRQNNRGGVLTQAVICAMNSDGKDSHPVKRGVWLLERILHDPPPPPPPNVPEVDLTNPEILKMTLKERIIDHRNKPACASCHARIDPWGIAFENYGATGGYRTHINNQPIDASAELFNHHQLNGMEGLKHYLLTERQDQFARAMVHKLMSYALGRPLSFGDRADIDSLTAQFRQREDRLQDLIQLLVHSEIFQSQ